MGISGSHPQSLLILLISPIITGSSDDRSFLGSIFTLMFTRFSSEFVIYFRIIGKPALKTLCLRTSSLNSSLRFLGFSKNEDGPGCFTPQFPRMLEIKSE